MSVSARYRSRNSRFTFNTRHQPGIGCVRAKLVGREPSQAIREDLRRLKQILEAGEIARAHADYE